MRSMTDGTLFILCQILISVYVGIGFSFIRNKKWNR